MKPDNLALAKLKLNRCRLILNPILNGRVLVMPVSNNRSRFRVLIVVAGSVTCAAALAIGLTIWWLRAEAINSASREAGSVATILAEQTDRSVQLVELLLNELKDRIEVRGARTSNDFRR